MLSHFGLIRPRARRLCALAAILIGVVPAAAQVATYVDLNDDCVVDNGDLGVLLASWGPCASPCPADLNGDMEVDGIDQGLLLSAWETQCPPFTVHWNAVGIQALQVTLDPDLDAVMQRDVVILSEHHYGIFPSAGLHLTFGRNGIYTNWETYHQQYLARHVDEVEEFVYTPYPNGPGLTAAYEGRAIIDYESWRPVWENNSVAVQEEWETFIAAINSPAWDQEFLAAIAYTPPAGVNNFRQLDEEEEEDFLKLSWDHFAKEFYLLSLHAGRVALPEARFGFYGFPQRVYWEPPGQVGYPEAQKGYNDEMIWLWQQVDILVPSIYQPYYSVDPDNTLGSWQNPSDDNATYIIENIAEALRLRGSVTHDPDILAYVAPFYHGNSTTNPNPYFETAVNDINLDQQVRMSRYAGADGIVIWGFVTCLDACGVCASDANSVGCWEYEMNTRWKPVILDVVADCP
ncbi:MAG TPA: hypothetical protein VD971_13165 [Phycisphaerales bacterium]|nr:hypothetical protein [Phycisphaerales bacterium]